MSSFQPLALAVNKRFNALSQHELFVAGADTDELWATYIASFPEGSNPIYKTNTEHECTCCRNFVKNLGNAVAIIDGKIETIWDVDGLVYPYKEVAEAMNAYVLTKGLVSVLRRSEPAYGSEHTKQLLEGGVVKKWNHFFGTVAARHFTKSVGEVVGQISTTIQVFQRGLDELTNSAISQVVEMIEENTLYRGQEHSPAIKEFKKHLVAYSKLTTKKQKKIYVYSNYASPAARFRNTVIGTLIQDISAGVDVEQAVRSFEVKVAPANYKRPTALITPRMVDDAMKTIGELGLEPALERRFAKLSDVSVNNVLWVDGTVKPQMKDGVAGLLMEAAATNVQTSKVGANAEDIGIDAFMANVLPAAKSMDVFVRNAHTANFVSVTAPVQPDSGSLFKWDNDFAWSYDGNITDSIREKVKKAGGNVEGKLRFSLAWFNTDDLDLHVATPNGATISFRNRHAQGGHLDVDANGMDGIRPDPVENVAFNAPADGVYTVMVDQYSKRQNHDYGFVLQVAHGEGQVFELAYTQPVTGTLNIGQFTVKNGEIVKCSNVHSKLLPEGVSKDKWGIKTETFAKVQTMMFSPNYWDDNAVGNKHWFFILEGCANDEPTRGIYNEFLASGLEKHRKVFEILGNKTKCPVVADQLSGLGFSSTRGDTVLVSVKAGRSQKTYNIKF